jgi:surface carbohydrate biosynthesis protein
MSKRQAFSQFWRLVQYFWRAKKIWTLPSKSRVLIFDATGHEHLLPYLEQWAPVLIHVRGEAINLPILMFSLFRPGRRFDAYVDSYIDAVKPRLVITFIQNNSNFHSIGVRNSRVKTIFVQNGVQSYWADLIEVFEDRKVSKKSLKVDFMLTFGRHVGSLYSRYIQGEIVPIGSLRNNASAKSETKKVQDTIAFISQFREISKIEIASISYSHETLFAQVDRVILGFLAEYIKDAVKTLVIIMRSHASNAGAVAAEKAYFKEMVGDGAVYWTSDSAYGGYSLCDAAEVVVSTDSALGYESAVRGNKTAIFSIRGAMTGISCISFGWPASYPDIGPFWTNNPDPLIFRQIVDHLFGLNHTQWACELAEARFDDVMAYDPGNTTLRHLLANLLEG